MKQTLQALGVAVLVFAAVEIVLFVVSFVILEHGSVLDANGVTSTPSFASQQAAVTLENVGFLVALLLAGVGGIAFAVRRRNP